jgi:hypothetical protein
MKLETLINQAECPRLNEKYKGIAALPLDLPKFELDSPDDFWRIWNNEKERVARQTIDRGAIGATSPSLEHSQWDGLAMYEDLVLLKDAAWKTKLSYELAQTQPNYMMSLFQKLPFVRIRSIRMWSSNCVIPAHYDGNMPSLLDGVMHFPTEIRLMLDDKNPSETFWLCSSAKYKPNTKEGIPLDDRYYVTLPSDTNTFAWNNEDYLHGADYDPQYRKILVVIKGWVDVTRLEELLDRSIAKYPSYVIRP